MPDLCSCKKCGWVHMAMTQDQAVQAIDRFNAYFDTLTPEEQQDFYGGKKSSIQDYMRCHRCGNKDFRPYKEGDAPDGVTIGPIIWENPNDDFIRW